MVQMKMITRCSSCGARNRIILPSGKKVRIRCGQCGAPITVTRREVLIKGSLYELKNYFEQTLPLFLISLVDIVLRVLGLLFAPVYGGWKKIPARLRKRLAWFFFAALILAYMLLEGTIKVASLLMLFVILLLATLAIVLIVSGPAAVREILSQWGAKIVKRCPQCGQRFFSWLKGCPRCGE